jgi:type VII secretion-associated serine protease mycosin
MLKKWIKQTALVVTSASLLMVPAMGSNAFAVTKQTNVQPSFLNEKEITKSQNQKDALSKDTLVIKFAKPLTQTEHRKAGGMLVKQFSNLNYAVVKVQNKKSLDKVIKNYQSLSKVKNVTPSAIYKPFSLEDPKASEQYQNAMLQLEKAQSLAGKNQVIVAVIDQGVDAKHPDLKGTLLPGYNTVNPVNQGSPDYHGTHVAGIIAAKKDNGMGGYGVNPQAKILPIDVFDRGWGASDFAIAQGILHAVDKGAKVINMSLGGPMRSPLIEEAIKKAAEKNVVIIAAAGNSGDDSLSYPAAYEGVISVGSVNEDKTLSSFSTFGTSVDLVAPGNEIYSTIYEYEKKSSYRPLSGTSMATPMVAGIASLLLSKYPKLTPIQIEYILEHTAEDLGEKGFDVKFGNGLVNAVKALQFDMKKLPALTKKVWTEQEILKDAKVVDLAKPVGLRGGMIAPFEEKWFKSEVQKGDKIQFVLNGASKFDYKLMLHFYSEEGNEAIDLNKVREGLSEGKFFEAPASGTLAFGVKEVNGSYDDSGRGESKFYLQVEKKAELPADESTIDQPIKISLPYDSGNNKFTLIGEEGDDDYYSFSVKDEQAISIALSELPGVNTSLSVYMADQIFPPDFETWPEEEKQSFLDALLSGEMQLEPFMYENKGRVSEGEKLHYTAMQDMTYIVKVSNKIDNYYGYYDFFFDPSMMEEEQAPESSMISYSLEINGKILPPDEDMFPMFESGEEEEGNVEKTKEAINEEEEYNPELEFLNMVREASQPYEIGGKGEGYLQMMEDEDWFAVTPDETGIYDFNFAGDHIPLMEIYQIVEEEDMEGETISYLSQIGSNLQFDWYSVKFNRQLFTGLKKGETYYVKVGADYFNGNVSYDPYTFTSKLIIKNPQDKHEDNDKPENIKNLPGSVVEGNFAMPHDQDFYYLESKKSEIYTGLLERKAIDEKWKKQYPKGLVEPFYGVMIVIEDINKNRKLDIEEYDRMQAIEKGIDAGKTYGSFKVEKGKNYIIAAFAYMEGVTPLTLWPYKMTIAPANLSDEDKGSVVKNNIPSKPISLAKKSKTVLSASGNLNAGVPYGDEDWYVLKLDKKSKGKIEFAAGAEVDGVVSIYKNGKLVTTSDFYPEGDAEVVHFNLTKGIYHIKVRDTFGNSTITPYKLEIKLQ